MIFFFHIFAIELELYINFSKYFDLQSNLISENTL